MATLDQTFTDHPPLDSGFETSSAVAYPSASRTATPQPAIFKVPGSGGLTVVIDVTAVSGASSVVFTIEGVDRASGKTWVLLTSAARVATGTTVLRVHPNLTASANLIAQDMVPPEFLIRATHGTSDATSYSVGVHLAD